MLGSFADATCAGAARTLSAAQPRLSDLASDGFTRAPASDAAYLEGLNPEQREAVLATEGPVLVLAGAGTGKTRVLTTRLAHILATGRARPWELLAVTFTNKAAREMRERIGHLIGDAAEGLRWVGTFHSVSAQILRRHAELVGLRSNYTILDVDDQERLLKQLIEAENIDSKRWTAKTLANLIDGWKNRGLTPDRLPADENTFANGRAQALYAQYQDRLRVLNACDFGDLLLHNIILFSRNPDLLAEYHRRFRYLLVDEYQDTNVAQYGSWPDRTGTSAAWATTTSPSTAGGGRRWTTFSVSSATSRAPRWSGSSATTAPPLTSWAPPPG